MKNNLLEQIILYIIVVCVALIIATLARISAMAMGFDSFTTFMVFIVAFAILVVVYLSIHVILNGLMLPWIGKWLSKTPCFRNKIEAHPVDTIPESITEQEPMPSLDDIRNEQLQNKAKEQEKRLNTALDYTRKTFAPYVSDEHIESLCSSVKIYADKLSLNALHPIKIKDELSNIDVSHFGWNIWNHFRVGKQIDIAYFLKNIFPDVFKDVEIETIKKHLKDDELKGSIKIQESIVLLLESKNIPNKL